MNVELVDLAPCKKMLRVEFSAEEVAEAIKTTTGLYQKNVSVRGFRTGKAPQETVVKLYADSIKERVSKDLMEKGIKEAVNDKKLRVASTPRLEGDETVEDGKPFTFSATVEVFPTFELPDYKGLPINIEKHIVGEEDVQNAIHTLQERMCSYKDSDKAAESSDVAVINYTCTCEGKSVAEIAPAATRVASGSNFWVRISKDSFLPGFTEQLVGMKAGDKKTVSITFPEEFPETVLAGKKGDFEVELTLVKLVELPEANDELAKLYGAKSIEDLKRGVRNDLEANARYLEKQSIETQIAKGLLSRVNFDLPESFLESETQSYVERIIAQARERKTPEAAILKMLPEIKKNAAKQAEEDLKVSIIISRIATAENIKPSELEIKTRVSYLAQTSGMPQKKFFARLKETRGVDRIASDIVRDKTIDALKLYAVVTEVPAAAAKA